MMDKSQSYCTYKVLAIICLCTASNFTGGDVHNANPVTTSITLTSIIQRRDVAKSAGVRYGR